MVLGRRYLHLKNNIVIILSLLLNINYIYLLLKLFSFVHLAYGLFLSLALDRLLIAIMILRNYVLLIKYVFITINFFPTFA